MGDYDTSRIEHNATYPADDRYEHKRTVCSSLERITVLKAAGPTLLLRSGRFKIVSHLGEIIWYCRLGCGSS